MLATLSFAFTLAQDSAVLSPAEQEQVADRPRGGRRGDDQHPAGGAAGRAAADVQAEIIRINTEARPMALQVALLIPILAGLVGFANSFRMMRQPDPHPTGSAEGSLLADRFHARECSWTRPSHSATRARTSSGCSWGSACPARSSTAKVARGKRSSISHARA